MRKCVEKAFAYSLVIVSLLGTFIQTELIQSIIFVVIIPSFILSIVSFFSELSIKCRENAEKMAKLSEKVSNLEQENVDRDLELYKNGNYELPFDENLIPEKIFKQQSDSVNHLKDSIVYLNVSVFFAKSKKVLDKMTFVGYTLLFISLILSPYIYRWLSYVNLNSLTLWSLTLLYITLELKSEFVARTYDFIYKIYLRRSKKKNTSSTNEA